MELKEIYEQIGRNIIFLRKYYGISRKTLAKLINMPLNRLSRVEMGKSMGKSMGKLYDIHLMRLAQIFCISIDALLYENMENNM